MRKTVNYAKNKGTAGYPKIEYSIWRYIACNKINIPEHVAWMYDFLIYGLIDNYLIETNIFIKVFRDILLNIQLWFT